MSATIHLEKEKGQKLPILSLQRGKLRLREGNKVVQNQTVKWVTDLKATCGTGNGAQVVKTKLAC